MAPVKSFGERIADALVEDGLLATRQVEELLEQQKKEGTRLLKLVLEKATEKPSLIIFDLNLEESQPLKLIAKLKGKSETKGISLIGYLSHIQAELKQQAQEAGCDMVLARSAFSQNLPQIFKRHSGIG